MERITNKHLDHQLKILNKRFGIEDAKWNTVGHFYVEGTASGYKLVRVIGEGGGCTDINSNRGTKREVYEQLRVLNEGLRLFQKETN